MEVVLNLVLLGFLYVLYQLYRRWIRISIAHVPGPKPESFFLGNLRELLQSQAGLAEFKWQAKHGDVVRLKGSLGSDRLLLSDPKAIQYIFQTSGYNFDRTPDRREFSRILSGRGVLWAAGEVHKRHRKVLLPGFSGPIAKACIPVFFSCASKLAGQWRDVISSSSDQSHVFDALNPISRAALDAIGKVAFDIEFGSLDDADNALTRAYSHLLLDTFGAPSKGEIFLRDLLSQVPEFMRVLFGDYAPSPKLKRARAAGVLGNKFARELVELKSEALLQGKGNKDMMTLLVKANASENEQTRLSEEELFSQMRTLLLAGHETTANSLSWMLLELAQHPEIQKRVRRDIRAMQRTIRSRGGSEFTPADLDAMAYFNAFVKESLRFHPVVLILFREAAKDDVLPLSKPIVTATGETLTTLPIPKGLHILASISAYNRNKDLFGEDSHTFDPERWLDSRVQKSTTVGVVGNLMTFSGGIRSCIGWKFAMAELQAFLVELLSAFEFELTPEAKKIRREAAFVMVPTIPDQLEKGCQLPLRVRLAPEDEDF